MRLSDDHTREKFEGLLKVEKKLKDEINGYFKDLEKSGEHLSLDAVREYFADRQVEDCSNTTDAFAGSRALVLSGEKLYVLELSTDCRKFRISPEEANFLKQLPGVRINRYNMFTVISKGAEEALNRYRPSKN